MKIREIMENKEDNMPHLYLDMDGVQADFFGSLAKNHNVHHWKAIQDKEDVMNKLGNSGHEKIYNFFRNLEPLPGGQLVIKWLKDNNIPFTVLSAPLRGPYSSASIQAKKEWLDEFNPGTSANAIFTSEKYKYALAGGRPNVLVDDFGPYIQKWKDAGGIPVKHEDEGEDPNTAEKTIAMLEKIYSPYLNK